MMRDVLGGASEISDRASSRSRAGRLANRLRRWRGGGLVGVASAPAVGAALEPLEQRCLMSVGATTTPFISEFLAVNNSGLKDEDGSRPDWIELYNPTASDVNLGGYFLTNDAGVLPKWALPTVTIPSGGFLTVFASGKNRVTPGQPLHTNFTLDAGGSYLGLVAPDGTTVLSDFSPSYPAQVADVSYGVAVSQTVTPLVGPSANARTLVPTNGTLGTTWTSPTFNDAGWTAGRTGVGYETDPPPPPTPGIRVRMVDVAAGSDGDVSNINEATAILDSPNGTAGGAFTVESDTSVSRSVINMGPGGIFSPDELLPNGMNETELYAIRAKANVFIPAGDWTINVNSDDGFRLKIPGVTFLTRFNENYDGAPAQTPDALVFGSPRGASDTFGAFTVPAGGLNTTLSLDFYENFGGDSLELSVASGKRTSVDTTNFSLLGNTVKGWTVSDPAAVAPLSYKPLIGTDVQAQMFDLNATAYVRVPFAVQNANDFDTLRLRMKYDDGFVAYVNGTEVARRNAPATLVYNSAAAANHPDADALVYETIEIPAGVLRTGSNVLAIHGLNAPASSTDFLIYPELQGFRTGVGEQPRFFADPKPGDFNGNSSADGVVADTHFSVDRGFFDAPFPLTITTATAGAEIRYTTNGQAPTATTGTVYTGPFMVDHTTTLRAAAFKTGFIPANVDTQTYIFLDDVVTQSPNVAPAAGWPAANTRVNNQIINYGMDPEIVNSPTWGPQLKNALKALPTFSIVTDAANLFNPSTGIYVNPSGDGFPWERPASLELINPDGSKGFQIDMGLRVRGGFSRSTDNPKHAFRLFFRNDYDGKLKYPMFGADAAKSFDGFDLRTTQNYSWAFGGDRGSIFMRDQFSRDTQLAMGQPAERGNWYHLYIDGQYWGLYNTDERAEANYGASYFGGNPEDYDVIKVDPDLGYNIEATDGNMDSWNQLYQLLAGNVTEDVFQLIQGNDPVTGRPDPTKPVLLDVDNLIDYMLVIYYGGNLDAPTSAFLGNDSPNNFFAVRNRNLDARQGFKFFAHDAEHTLLNVNENRLGPSPDVGWNAGSQGVNKSNPQWFFQRLWTLPGFKARLSDHVQQYLVSPGGALTPAAARERLIARRSQIDLATVAESARWGDSKTEPPITRNDFNAAFNNVLNNYIPSRTGVLLSQLRAWHLIPPFNAPVFSKQGGQVAAGFQLTLTPAAGTPAGSTMYYTLDGTDPRRRDGTLSPTAIAYTGPITVNETVTVRARTLTSAGVWSAANVATFSLDMASLRVTELMYNPAPPPAGSTFTRDDFEFIEIQNTGPGLLDLEGVKVAGGVDATFPAGFSLAAGGRAVVVKNRDAFLSRYPGFNAASIAGTYTGTLSDSGEELRLVSATGQTVLTFTYSDGWYPQTDGQGYSLSIIDPTAAAATWNLKSSWKPGGPLNGTPAAGDDSPPPNSVVVNEVLASPLAGGSGDFIELFNPGANDIDVSGWYLSNDAANPRRFQIPAGTILAAGGYKVFNQAALGFDVSPAGGDITLSSRDAAGNLGGYRDSVHFAASLPGVSFGQYRKSTGGTDFVSLSAATPGAANGAPLVGPVVINEVMYHPGTGQTEYIELHNITGSPVLLNDPANPTGAWKFVDGIDYVLPAGAVIPAFGYVLVVPIDPAGFRSVFDVPPGVSIYGPYQRADGSNNLSNAGENLTLYQPVAAGYALADRVNYLPVEPWPEGVSGTGASIIRSVDRYYGNDPATWIPENVGGTPGRINFDIDGPGADIVDVTPDPRTTAVSSVQIVFTEPVRGLALSDLALTRDGGANLLTGGETLETTDGVTWTVSGLAGLTAAPGSYTFRISPASFGVADWGGNSLTTFSSDTWRTGAPPNGRVVGRYVFYNNSRFDGGASGAADDAAVAPDKRALLPGQTATFANYTSYSRGINGVMIDASGLLADLTAADFLLQVGNDGDAGAWSNAPAPLTLTRRPGAGANGSDRITLTWADSAIKNQWLRVTLLPTARTGLPAADVFYFGNLLGETGNIPSAAAVTASDFALTRRYYTTGKAVAAIGSRYDFNRDGKVNATDLALSRRGMLSGTLTLITAPATTGGASVASASLAGTKAVFGQSQIVPPVTSTSALKSSNNEGSLLTPPQPLLV